MDSKTFRKEVILKHGTSVFRHGDAVYSPVLGWIARPSLYRMTVALTLDSAARCRLRGDFKANHGLIGAARETTKAYHPEIRDTFRHGQGA